MNQDMVNGAFELAGSIVIGRQCFHVLRDREVAGVRWTLPGFFWLWGLWNLFYYPSLQQPWSFAGACLVFLTHSCYAILLWRFYSHGVDDAAA